MRVLFFLLGGVGVLSCTSTVGQLQGDVVPSDAGIDAGQGAIDSGPSVTDSGTREPDAGQPDAGVMTVADAGRTPLAIGVGNWGLRGWTSDDSTWSYCGNTSTANDHTPDLLRNIVFGDGVWIAVGGDANSMVMRSLDGIHWQENLHPTTNCQGEPFPASCSNWKDGLAYGDGVWLAGGGNGSLMRSTDRGLTWAGLSVTPSIPAMRSLAFGQGVFVGGTDSAITVSPDQGASWARFPTPFSTTITFGGGRFFAQGSRWNGTGFDRTCFSSRDLGVSWQACAPAAANAEQFAHDGARWIARVGSGFISSADGLSWAAPTSVNNFPGRLRFDGARWLGFRGQEYLTSTDLINWTRLATNVPNFRNWAVGFVDPANLPVQGVQACQDNR